MAESLVSVLLSNLKQMLEQEDTTVSVGQRDLIEPLQAELEQVNLFLQDSKGKTKMVDDFLTAIRPLAQQTEDVIQLFVTKTAKLQKTNTLDKFAYSIEYYKILLSAMEEIKNITMTIATIRKTRDNSEIEENPITPTNGDNSEIEENPITPTNGENSEIEENPITPTNGDNSEIEENPITPTNGERNQVEENEVVSFSGDEETVIKVLSRGGQHLDVISITGMPGSGKTTLAKKIYNANQQFDHSAWVYVSQEFQTRDLLSKILLILNPAFMKDTSKMSEQNLTEEVKTFLKDKRYLVVLDDVWDVEVWFGIRSAFPDSLNSSRILITSRITDVATCANASCYYSPPLLNMNDSWKLFNRILFGGNDCPQQLVKQGRRIVKKCEGLPLAIVVMASLLAKEEESDQNWSKVAANVCRNFQKEQSYMEILASSYRSLPTVLKPCFLYFGLFPKGFEIPTRKLLELWAVERFIEREHDRILEDVGQDYLEELIGKGLITAVTRRSRDGSVKSCTIHDRLRDFCIYEGVRENFLTLHTKCKLSAASSRIKPRRLSLHCNTSRYISSPPCDTSSVRTLMCFGDEDIIKDVEKFTGFALVKVLDFGNTIVQSVPTDIKKLINLQYLRMNAPHLREIPSCISSLPNLQTLDIRESGILFLTDNFWKMQQLKHLFVLGDCDVPRKDQDQFKCMPNLETLSTISPQIINIIEDFMAVFPKVQKLGLWNSHHDVEVGSKVPEFRNIQNLKIIGPVPFRLPTRAFSWSLTKVTLLRTEISPIVFASLGKLPNLLVLKLLKQSLAAKDMKCNEGAFYKLQVLHMVALDITKWTMRRGAMKNLEYLLIKKCVELREIPEQLKHVNTLIGVNLSCCTSRLEGSIRSTLGENIHYEFESNE